MKPEEIKVIRLMLDSYMEGRSVFQDIVQHLAENEVVATAQAIKARHKELHQITERFNEQLTEWEMYGEIDNLEVLLPLVPDNPDANRH